MKVLTIREPFATFIKEGIKKVETRSWKTNYRGKLYVHAGISKDWHSKIKERNFDDLIKGLEFNYGYIVCEVELVDCIYMTKEYIKNIKNNNYQEYLVGRYEEGRYAWMFDNVRQIDEKISVKGKLGLWNLDI